MDEPQMNVRMPSGRVLEPTLPAPRTPLRKDFDIAVLVLIATSVIMGTFIGIDLDWRWKLPAYGVCLALIWWAGKRHAILILATEMWCFAQGRGAEAQVRERREQAERQP